MVLYQTRSGSARKKHHQSERCINPNAHELSVHSRPSVVVLSFGSNQCSEYGSARDTFAAAISWLRANGVHDNYMTNLWYSSPYNSPSLLQYANGIAIAKTNLSPRDVLRCVKSFERHAGRRPNMHRWSPRPIDIDVVSHGNRIVGWPHTPTLGSQLVLPHPRAHERAFVMLPLASAWPNWRHPVLGLTAEQLARRLPPAAVAAIKVA